MAYGQEEPAICGKRSRPSRRQCPERIPTLVDGDTHARNKMKSMRKITKFFEDIPSFLNDGDALKNRRHQAKRLWRWSDYLAFALWLCVAVVAAVFIVTLLTRSMEDPGFRTTSHDYTLNPANVLGSTGAAISGTLVYFFGYSSFVLAGALVAVAVFHYFKTISWLFRPVNQHKHIDGFTKKIILMRDSWRVKGHYLIIGVIGAIILGVGANWMEGFFFSDMRNAYLDRGVGGAQGAGGVAFELLYRPWSAYLQTSANPNLMNALLKTGVILACVGSLFLIYQPQFLVRGIQSFLAFFGIGSPVEKPTGVNQRNEMAEHSPQVGGVPVTDITLTNELDDHEGEITSQETINKRKAESSARSAQKPRRETYHWESSWESGNQKDGKSSQIAKDESLGAGVELPNQGAGKGLIELESFQDETHESRAASHSQTRTSSQASSIGQANSQNAQKAGVSKTSQAQASKAPQNSRAGKAESSDPLASFKSSSSKAKDAETAKEANSRIVAQPSQDDKEITGIRVRDAKMAKAKARAEAKAKAKAEVAGAKSGEQKESVFRNMTKRRPKTRNIDSSVVRNEPVNSKSKGNSRMAQPVSREKEDDIVLTNINDLGNYRTVRASDHKTLSGADDGMVIMVGGGSPLDSDKERLLKRNTRAQGVSGKRDDARIASGTVLKSKIAAQRFDDEENIAIKAINYADKGVISIDANGKTVKAMGNYRKEGGIEAVAANEHVMREDSFSEKSYNEDESITIMDARVLFEGTPEAKARSQRAQARAQVQDPLMGRRGESANVADRANDGERMGQLFKKGMTEFFKGHPHLYTTNKDKFSEIQSSECRYFKVYRVLVAGMMDVEEVDALGEILIRQFEGYYSDPATSNLINVYKSPKDATTTVGLKNGDTTQGTYYIIELPLKEHSFDYRDVLASSSFSNLDMETIVPLGRDNKGSMENMDLKGRKVLVTGEIEDVRNFLHTSIFSLLYKAKPNEVGLILINSRNERKPSFDSLDFASYRGNHYFVAPIVETVRSLGENAGGQRDLWESGHRKALDTLNWVRNEMCRREILMNFYDVSNIKDLNYKIMGGLEEDQCQNLFAENLAKPTRLGRIKEIVLIVNNLNSVLSSSELGGEILMALEDIAKNATTAHGIQLIVADSNFDEGLMKGALGKSFTDVVCFPVSNENASLSCINSVEASHLLGIGDFIHKDMVTGRAKRLQSPKMDARSLDKGIEYYNAKMIKPIYSFEPREGQPLEYGDIYGNRLHGEIFNYICTHQGASMQDVILRFRTDWNTVARIVGAIAAADKMDEASAPILKQLLGTDDSSFIYYDNKTNKKHYVSTATNKDFALSNIVTVRDFDEERYELERATGTSGYEL